MDYRRCFGSNRIAYLDYWGYLMMPRVLPAQDDDEVDRRIEVWHDMLDEEYLAIGSPELHHFLGWTWDEYAHWVMYNEIPKY